MRFPALTAADIYTKAFNDAPSWQCVMKLVNHHDPGLFWAGPAGGGKVHHPGEHKGGVKFSYLTPIPGMHSQMIEALSHSVPPRSLEMCGMRHIITGSSQEFRSRPDPMIVTGNTISPVPPGTGAHR